MLLLHDNVILIIPGDFYISIENKLYNKKFTKVLLVAKTTKCKLSIGCLLQACDFPWKYLIDKIWNSSFYYEYMNKTFHILFLAFVDVWCKINKIINLHNLHNWINYICRKWIVGEEKFIMFDVVFSRDITIYH
jgi:hypothetical protein